VWLARRDEGGCLNGLRLTGFRRRLEDAGWLEPNKEHLA
jgi:hypothetical protein